MIWIFEIQCVQSLLYLHICIESDNNNNNKKIKSMNLTCEKQEGLNIWKRGIYSINISIVTCTVNNIILIIYL